LLLAASAFLALFYDRFFIGALQAWREEMRDDMHR